MIKIRKDHVNVTLDSSVLNWIDSLRGQHPRSTFINKILIRFCEKTQDVFNWDEENRKAQEDINRGRVRKFRSHKEALQWLKT